MKNTHKPRRIGSIAPAQREGLFIVLFALIGYFVAMLIRKYWAEGKDKVTFVGVVGAALIPQARYKSAFAGLALYDLGHNAGLTALPTQPEPPNKLGAIANPNKTEYIEYKGKNFEVELSKWTPLYAKNDNGVWKPTFWDTFTKSPYQEKGIYFIRTRDKELIYVGVVADSKDGFHRLLRHFAQDNARDKILNHNTYSKTQGYEFRIAQPNNPTPERLYLLEEYYQRKLTPRDSFTESEQERMFLEDTIDANFEFVPTNRDYDFLDEIDRNEEAPF